MQWYEYFMAAAGELAARGQGNGWSTWPFGGDGSWVFEVAKGGFLLLIFAVIIWFVRRLFGPGGWLAEDWMREEWCADIDRQLAELDERLAAGEISSQEHLRRKVKLEAKRAKCSR